jgi:hypothetical protein
MTSKTSWRKSSFSGGGANDCVEVDRSHEHTGLRDSKATQTSIRVSTRSFGELLAAVKGA